jgi:acyl-CoA synthetase (AMP-forming)/AMP-acid ligase II
MNQQGEEPITESWARPTGLRRPTTAVGVPRPVSASRARGYAAGGYWDDRSLPDGIEAAASRKPEGVALIDDRAEVTWAALAGRVAAGASRLADVGLGPGTAAILLAGNTLEGVVAYHSLLRVGATAVLLDRRCGARDLRLALDSVPVSVVLLPPAEEQRLGGELGEQATIRLGELIRVTGPDGGVSRWREPDRHAPAVVLFTSGTTSRPKGVTHSLNTLTSGARNMAVTTGADESSVIYLVSPLTSITGVMQMHLAADCHSTLVLDDAFEPERSLNRINDCGATVLGGAPVIVERLIAVADARDDTGVALRTLALGGTLLPRAFLERVAQQYGIDVVRVYGSSEAPNATGRLPGSFSPEQLIDDGALMPGTEVRVGSSQHPQEGLLRGPGVMLGYLDEADNREAYEGEWLRSGDLVDVTEGRLTVIGRLKEIVNRNGFKISLSELDAALLGAPGIEEGAGFGVPDQDTGEHLAVAVVLQVGAQVTLETVLDHLGAQGLATRKLPEQMVIWDEPLPRTASGKVIRARLSMDAPSKRSMFGPRLRSMSITSSPEPTAPGRSAVPKHPEEQA